MKIRIMMPMILMVIITMTAAMKIMIMMTMILKFIITMIAVIKSYDND